MRYCSNSIKITLALALSASTSFAQHKNGYTSKVDSLIKTAYPRTFNGVILITRKGKTNYSNAYGYTNVDKKTPLKLDDQFEIMSISKQITAVLILKEVEKGKLKLNYPIKKYLPNLPQSWADTITVHQLLNHTNGIKEIKEPLLFKPGTQFSYGGLSYILLGQIIEKVSKQPYTRLAEELFQRLNMKNTYCYSKDIIKHLVSGHINKNNTITVYSRDSTQIDIHSIPSDGIVSTAKDVALWSWKLHNRKILKDDTYKLMTSYNTTAQHIVFGEDKIGYGYGIRISDKKIPNFFGHTGLGDGFATVNLYFPESDICLTILENQINDSFELSYYFGTEILKLLIKSDLVIKK